MAVPDPQGWKEVSVNEVETAAGYQGYVLQQVITVFADATARDAAITEPKEGQYSHLKDTDLLTRYNGAAWETAAPPSDFALAGETLTEQTMNGTSAADLLTVTGLTIAKTQGIIIEGLARKTDGAGAAVGLGLKINSTVVGEATADGGTAGWLSSGANQVERGSFRIWIPPRVTGHLLGGHVLRDVYTTAPAQAAAPAMVSLVRTNLLPDAETTAITIRAISGSASVTVGVQSVRVFTVG